MFRGIITPTLCVGVAIVISLAFNSPLLAFHAGTCGGGHPCACGDTVNATRTLDKGVDPIFSTTCTGDGLIMNTSGVNLKLGGGVIRGDGDAGDVGIRILTGVNNLTIKGPEAITGFGTGIKTDGETSGTTIEIVKAATNKADGINISGDGNTLKDNHTNENGGEGIEVTGNGNTITLNRAAKNAGEGIQVTGDNNHIIEKNAGSKSGANGIKVVGNNNDIVFAHQTHHNKLHGIRVIGSGNCVQDNATTRNKELDILVSLSEADENSDGNNIDGGGNNFNQGGLVSTNCKIDGVACNINAPSCFP